MPAAEQQLPGQVDVLGRHPRVVAADREDAVAAKQAEDAGDDADPSGQRLGAANQTDDRRRLQHLHSEEKSAAVRHVRRPGDSGQERRARDASDQQLERLGMHVRVGVGDCDELVARLAEAGVQLLGLAAIDRVADHPAARVACACLERCGFGGVGGAVVEDDHLELRIVGGDCGRDAGRDHGFLVVGRDQHRHSRPASGGLLGSMPLLEHAEEESSGDPDRSGAQRIERDERQQ